MGFEKSEIKMSVAQEIGNNLDDALESAKVEINRWEGGKFAHVQTTQGIDHLIGHHLKKDLEEDKLTMEDAERIKRYLLRAKGLVENLSIQCDSLTLKAKGKVEALEKAVLITKKVYDSESRKRTSLLTPEEPDERTGPTRAVGAHPGPSIAQQRRAEAAAAKPKKKAPRKCGKCGVVGHTARGCKKAAKKK